ncbi:hypothetical protein R50072_00850 [Simiduia litorea]|uniref:hypothetical protein n=1 Tax=Simiduia litorea TaxID=1435348 RepID=UPI0036F447F7
MNPCPKCQYLRQAKDASVHPDICPACGIATNKWRPPPTVAEARDGYALDDQRMSLREHFMQLPNRVDSGSLWGRGVIWLGLSCWAAWFLMNGIDWQVIGGSFMHNINLPFHEFGHVLFMPFGRFMAILGGSLFQILLPLGLCIGFSFFHNDNFAASVTLWWCGQSFVDLAPYIADAEYRLLPLVGGGGEESHDWGNLLTWLNMVDSAHAIARASFFIGGVIMMLALVWGFQLLRKQKALEAQGY